MKNLKLVPLFFVISMSLFARSGGVGNGGDIVICEDSYTLLDSYEASKLGLTLNLNNSNLETQSLRSMVSLAVNNLSAKDKYTAKKLFEYAMEMVNDFEQFKMFPNPSNRYKGKVVYLSPDIVGEISDSNHRTLPESCEVRQLVSQIQPTRSLENRYEINKTLWDKLSLQDQAMTILHEAWYRIMIEDGATDSVGARYMNALIASEEFKSYEFSDYIKDLQSTEKENYIIENKSTLVFDSLFKLDLKNSNLSFESNKVCTDSLNVRANIKRLAWFTEWHLGVAKIKFENVCFNNSTIESLTLPQKFSGKRINFVMENYLVRTSGSNGNSGVIQFHKNGTLKEIKNLAIETLYKMYYTCGRGRNKIKTFIKKDGCKGPYLHHDSEVKNPGQVNFDYNEVPLGFEFPIEP